MTDITMCADKACAARRGCFRYRCRPGAQQSYQIWPRADGDCNGYWPLIWAPAGRARPMEEIEPPRQPPRLRVIESHDPNAARRALLRVVK